MAGNCGVYGLRKIKITGVCAFFGLASLSQIDIVSRGYASRRGFPTVPPCGKLQGFATLTVNPVFKLFLILGKSERPRFFECKRIEVLPARLPVLIYLH